jgi:hypothetical protein
MKESYTCHNEECGHEFDVTFYPSTPNTGMSGRWEDSEQGSAAECDPSECPQCCTEVNVEEVESDCTPDPDDYMEPDWE